MQPLHRGFDSECCLSAPIFKQFWRSPVTKILQCGALAFVVKNTKTAASLHHTKNAIQTLL